MQVNLLQQTNRTKIANPKQTAFSNPTVKVKETNATNPTLETTKLHRTELLERSIYGSESLQTQTANCLKEGKLSSSHNNS